MRKRTAVVTSDSGFECFWQLDEPELLRQFAGSYIAYFQAGGRGTELTIWKRVRAT